MIAPLRIKATQTPTATKSYQIRHQKFQSMSKNQNWIFLSKQKRKNLKFQNCIKSKCSSTQCAESTRKRAVPVQSICRPINFEGYYIYVNMIGQQLTDSCKWDQLSCFRISADRQELASFYTLEQKFETNVMC